MSTLFIPRIVVAKCLLVTATMLPIALITTPPASAQGIAKISNLDAATGLKDALAQGAAKAVSSLGQQNGFLGNNNVKIPLPAGLQRVEGLMRGIGMGSYADQLVNTMNQAAESAVVEARPLLADAIKRMTVQDAKGILSGPQDSATQYFQRTTSAALTQRFMPIVKQATAKVQLADTYNNFAGKAATFGLLKADDANLDAYVTQKALDGLFFMIAQEEKAIRDNPLAAATSIAKTVFGALGR